MYLYTPIDMRKIRISYFKCYCNTVILIEVICLSHTAPLFSSATSGLSPISSHTRSAERDRSDSWLH